MEKSPIISSVLCVIFAIIGAIFSYQFQGMAYWGPHKTLTMKCYWIGASLSYAFSVAAILVTLIRNYYIGWFNVVIRVIGTIIAIASIVWKTFIIIAWQSGM